MIVDCNFIGGTHSEATKRINYVKCANYAPHKQTVRVKKSGARGETTTN